MNVEQERFRNPQTGAQCVAVVSITLDNGVRLYPYTTELGHGYAVEFTVDTSRKHRTSRIETGGTS
jgi:hypothetical protein